MKRIKTLLELSNANLKPVPISEAVVIVIDMQNEYLEGPLEIDNANIAVNNASLLLKAAREENSPIIHVVHRGAPRGLFDRCSKRGEIIDGVRPQTGELVVEKSLPNAFANTNLKDLIDKTKRRELLLCGFMTHLCISSTARAALDLGYRTTIAASACATRSLLDENGHPIAAETIHKVSLAALSDRFAIIAYDSDIL